MARIKTCRHLSSSVVLSRLVIVSKPDVTEADVGIIELKLWQDRTQP